MKQTILTIIFIFFTCSLIGQIKTGYLTNDGAWCWFSDPRAIMIKDNFIAGWVKSNGTIEAAKFNTNKTNVETNELYYHLEKDDHNNPSFARTASGEVIAMYTRHSKKDLFINRLKGDENKFNFSKAQMIHPISKKELKHFPRETITYANPYRLEKENNRIYCFGRWTGFKPSMMWSDDNGISWSKSKVIVTNHPFNADNRPYVKYYSDGNSKIHIVFTDGHPKVEPTNSVYYAYYEKGAFYKASGKKICDIDNLPFEPKDADIIYTSKLIEGRAWIADIGQDKNNNPVLLYTKSPSIKNHEYWYSSYTNKEWNSYKICDSGPWFPQTIKGKKELEPYYFGGMSIHPSNTNVIYLSRLVNGIFEIERWETKNKGENWKSEAITKNSIYDNVRPSIPQGLKNESNEIVLWMEAQKYLHYTKYKTSIKYFISDVKN